MYHCYLIYLLIFVLSRYCNSKMLKFNNLHLCSRTPCGCVDWNTWNPRPNPADYGRTPCGCVDWNWMSHLALLPQRCRTPCGCVDWNITVRIGSASFDVASHAGAWIETWSWIPNNTLPNVAPHAGAWIETTLLSDYTQCRLVAPHAGAWIETWCRK